MNNKHLSWYKEINNNFIIASRAYFLHGSPRKPPNKSFQLRGGLDVPNFAPVIAFILQCIGSALFIQPGFPAVFYTHHHAVRRPYWEQSPALLVPCPEVVYFACANTTRNMSTSDLLLVTLAELVVNPRPFHLEGLKPWIALHQMVIKQTRVVHDLISTWLRPI